MKTFLFACILLVGCKSSFFTLDRRLPDYEMDQRIEILKLSKETPEYYIFKARAEDYHIPFYMKTNYKYTVGEVVVYSHILKTNESVK